MLSGTAAFPVFGHSEIRASGNHMGDRSDFMTFGMILLIVSALLIAFGVGQRVLDRLRLTDVHAYVIIGLIIAAGFIPEIPLGRVGINIGGCVIEISSYDALDMHKYLDQVKHGSKSFEEKYSEYKEKYKI